jgi:cyclopropane fatty-acyl-phospholipid synthase-like methyltransferase
MSEDIWDEWNRHGATVYPQDKVVQFCFHQFGDNMRGKCALDLGCGSGVHTVFLAAEGFNVAATDKSPVGIANTREKLNRAGLTAELKVESADVVSFPADSFDLVICIGILDTVGSVIAATAISRVKDVIRPGGRGLFIFSSDKDDAVGHQGKISLHGYKRPDVEKMFEQGFSRLWIDRYSLTLNGGAVDQDEWIVAVRK